MIKRFDVVLLKTIKNVKMLSGPANKPASPKGAWTVCAWRDTDLILAKDETIIIIPSDDVVKVGDYNVESYLKALPTVRSQRDLDKLIGDKDGKKTRKDI